MATLKFPRSFGPCISANDEKDIVFSIEGEKTIQEILEWFVNDRCPNLKFYLLGKDDLAISKYISVYVNGENIKTLRGGRTIIKDADAIEVVSAIAGG